LGYWPVSTLSGLISKQQWPNLIGSHCDLHLVYDRIMVRNDAPTNLRRGFGYYQARRSGMGGIRRDRSPNQINEAIDENNAVVPLVVV